MKRLLALALPLLAGAAPLALFLDGPPPGFTGGFGEPTCRTCHFDVPAPDPAGAATLAGLPAASYTPGVRYLLRVALRRPGMAAAGFQLSARTDTGAQAGTLGGDSARVGVNQKGGVHFAHHTRRSVAARDSAEWVVEWTAPAGGAVHLHLAASAADGDESPFGDHVYTDSLVIGPAVP